MLPEEVLDYHFEVCQKDAGIPPEQKETVNQNQLRKLYAKAREEKWEDGELDALCKDALGYESKKHIHPGSAFDEILDALEEKTLRNLLRENMEDAMPRFLKATCTGEASKKKTKKYGMRVVADFETPEGEEIAIWTDPDTELSDALFGIPEGDVVNIIQKDDGGNTLEDSEIEKYAPRGKKRRGQGGGSENKPSSSKSRQKTTDDLPTWGYVNHKQHMIQKAYVNIVTGFKKKAQNPDIEGFGEEDIPGAPEIIKAAISSTIDR